MDVASRYKFVKLVSPYAVLLRVKFGDEVDLLISLVVLQIIQALLEVSVQFLKILEASSCYFTSDTFS